MRIKNPTILNAGGSIRCPIFLLGLLLCICVAQANGQDTRCAFDVATFTFAGNAQEQARCLLRPVKKFAHLGPQAQSLPEPLDSLVGQRIDIDRAKFTSFLTANRIKEADVGGALSGPLSSADANNVAAGRARYFMIHDTSSPNFLNEAFPANINDPAAPLNRLDRFRTVAREKVAHVFINRGGESATAVDFKSPLAAGRFGTKFAARTLKERRKGLLLHVELIQPRRRDPSGGRLNDALAPDPGFTEAQLDRLAVVYVAASIRRGEWMIPAFHAVMDITIPDGHDDPQRFDLDLWAARLKLLLDQLQR